jgi:hypothetical protein
LIRISPTAREDLLTVLSSELAAGRAARILIDDYT